MSSEDLSWREKAHALYRVAKFQPRFAIGVVILSVIAALFEGFGISFIMPIVEVGQAENPVTEADGLLGVFVTIYQILGIPFTLGYLVTGVAIVMTMRFTTSFLVGWFRAALETRYVRYLQEKSFTHALDSEVSYFDEEGSDDILNTIVTQAEYAGRVIKFSLFTVEQALLAGMYFLLAFLLAPQLTLATGILLGGFVFGFRRIFDTGYSIGDEVADSKEEIQSNAQAGTQGIRDVKLFGLEDELKNNFWEAIDKFERNRISLMRNQGAITNFYQLVTAISVFGLIYFAITYSAMSVGELGVFLFAMFRLGPKVSKLNKHIYRVEGELPHLVRTQKFIDSLEQRSESTDGKKEMPSEVNEIIFENIHFSYGDEEQVLQGIGFKISKGEFIAFVGQSGAGKSTIVSLLSQLYQPNEGNIKVDNTPIEDFPLKEWREHIAVVRQDPFIFNKTLRENITIGNRGADKDEINRVCDIAKVSEFIDELPDGYETTLGDDGVRLSGGQRQRVALARALLKDADFLVLDEATSDLDSNLEQEVQTAIESMDREYGIIAIAHRLSTVKNADQIYTLDNGSIIESGTHDELLSKKGEYAQLYTLQSKG